MSPQAERGRQHGRREGLQPWRAAHDRTEGHPVGAGDRRRHPGQLRRGINPNDADRQRQAAERQKRKANDLADITLGQAFEKYIQIKPLRASTLAGYRVSIERDFAKWKDKPLREITGAMAVTRHAELVKESKHTATRGMRVLRAVHKFATDFWGDDDNELPFGRCPVDKVNRVQRQWSRAEARTNKLRVDDLAPWFAAVRRLPEDQHSGDGARMGLYLELVLLTGLRRREAGFMRWRDVDFRRGTLTVRQTKNHTDHTLPLSKRVREILLERKRVGEEEDRERRKTEEDFKPNEYVFGSAEVRWQLLRIERETGIHVTPHDLRRIMGNLRRQDRARRLCHQSRPEPPDHGRRDRHPLRPARHRGLEAPHAAGGGLHPAPCRRAHRQRGGVACRGWAMSKEDIPDGFKNRERYGVKIAIRIWPLRPMACPSGSAGGSRT